MVGLIDQPRLDHQHEPFGVFRQDLNGLFGHLLQRWRSVRSVLAFVLVLQVAISEYAYILWKHTVKSKYA